MSTGNPICPVGVIGSSKAGGGGAMKPLLMGGPPIRGAEGPEGGPEIGPRGAEGAGPPTGRGPFMPILAA